MRIVLEVRYGGNIQAIEFPCSEKRLQAGLEKINVPKAIPPKLYVEKVTEPEGLWMLSNRVLNLDEVNYFAKRMDGQTREENDKLYAVAEAEGITDVKALINQTFNPGCYTLIQDISNAEKLGRLHEMTLRGGMTLTEERSLDFAKIGRELLYSGGGVMTEHGLLFRNKEIVFEEVYDGQVFPPYWYDGNKLLSIELKFNGKSEYIYLPEEERAIEKALKRLGASKPGECVYEVENFNTDWEVMAMFSTYLTRENIYKVNQLAEKMNREDLNIGKLRVMIRYAEDDSLETVIKLAEHIDDFECIEGVEDYEEIGRSVLMDCCIGALPLDAEEYIDYEKFGRHIAEDYCGKMIDGKFIYIKDGESLEEILKDGIELKMGGNE